MKYSAAQIKSAIQGREREVLIRCAGIPEEILDGKNHPCPLCGGKDRFRFIDQTDGTVFCNQCFREKNAGPINAVMHFQSLRFPEALEVIARELAFQEAPAVKVRPPREKKLEDKKYEFKSTFQPVYDSAGGPKVMRMSSFAVGRKPWGFDLKWNGYSYVFESRSQQSKTARHTVYEYTDGDGSPSYMVHRTDFKDGRKIPIPYRWENGVYVQGKPESGLVPFYAPDVKECGRVFIVEGEKCAVALKYWLDKTRKPEFEPDCATCFIGGSSQFLKEYGPWFDGKDVILIPDNDQAGKKYLRMGIEAMNHHAARFRVFQWPEGTPEKWDIADEIKKNAENSRVLQGLAGVRMEPPAMKNGAGEKPP